MTKRDRIMLAVVAALAIAGGYYMVVLKPIKADRAALDEQHAQAVQRRDSALADLNAASTAREAYRRDTATLALLGKAVPSDDGVPSLLYQMQSAARRAGVEFDAVRVGEGSGQAAAPASGGSSSNSSGSSSSGSATPSTGTPAATLPGVSPGPEGLSVLPLKITFRGSFFRLERFLNQVHRFARVKGERVDISGRLLTIDNVSLTPASSGLPQLKAEISASAYVAPDPSKPAAAATTASATTPTTSTPAAGATR